MVEWGLHVYALNPKQADRFRDRHTVAGAKDDRRDAYVLGDALRTDRPKFRRVELDHPLVIQIREVSRADEDLRDDFVRLTNRFREQLYRSASPLLQLSPTVDEPWFWDLVERLFQEPGRRLTRTQASTLLRRHRIRRLDADQVLKVVHQKPVSVAPGAEAAARSHVALLLPRLRLVHEQRKQCDKRLRELLEEYGVSKSATLDEVPPSLQPHYRTFDTTTRYSVSVPRIGTQALVGASHLRGSLCIGATGSHVPHQSLDQGHAQPVRRTPPGP